MEQTQEYVKEYIADLVPKAKKAQKEFEAKRTNQHDVDEVVRAIGKICYDNAKALALEAVEETGMGNIEGKIGKTRQVALRQWDYLKGRPSVGVIDDFSEPGVKIVAKPAGVVGAVMPGTNPVATVICNAMCALKSRNAIIIAPHPSGAKSSNATVDLMRQALEAVGAPADLVQGIREPSLAMTTELLHQADLNVATGGPGMVKSVYSAGKPAYGVGQGNCQAIVDVDYPDFALVAKTAVANRSFDLGIPCTGEQNLLVPAAREQEMLDALRAEGAFIIEDEETIDRIRKLVFPTDSINRAVVGKEPHLLGQMLGVDIPETARVITFKLKGCGMDDVLCKEILCPMLRYTTYEGDYKEAVRIAVANLEREGAGHSSSIWSKHPDHIEYAANLIPVGRFHVEQPTIGANNGAAPSATIGCGTWGGTASSSNIQYYHFMNVTRVTTQLPVPNVSVEADWDDWSMRTEWGSRVYY